jgi:hypothetical protein
MIAVAAMGASRVVPIPRVAVVAVLAVTAGCGLGTLARNVLRRTVEPAQLLAQRFDLALVGGLLALGQFEQLEDFVELIQRLAERRDHGHHLVDGLANRFRMRRLGGARRRTLLARADVLRPAWLLPGFGRLVGNFNVG